MLSSADRRLSDAVAGVFVSQLMSNLAWLVRLFLVRRAELGQPLSERCRGDVVQEGLCEQEVMLAFSARMSPSLSALRDSRA